MTPLAGDPPLSYFGYCCGRVGLNPFRAAACFVAVDTGTSENENKTTTKTKTKKKKKKKKKKNKNKNKNNNHNNNNNQTKNDNNETEREQCGLSQRANLVPWRKRTQRERKRSDSLGRQNVRLMNTSIVPSKRLVHP